MENILQKETLKTWIADRVPIGHHIHENWVAMTLVNRSGKEGIRDFELLYHGSLSRMVSTAGRNFNGLARLGINEGMKFAE